MTSPGVRDWQKRSVHYRIEQLEAELAELREHLAQEHSSEDSYAALKAQLARAEDRIRELEAGLSRG